MSEFKIGQTIEVLAGNPYGITVTRSRGIITAVHPWGEAEVKMTFYPIPQYSEYIGAIFQLDTGYLKILAPAGSEDISPVCLKIREMEERRKNRNQPEPAW